MTLPLLARTVAVLPMDVFPDFGAVGNGGTLAQAVGALLTIVLIVAVLMTVVCAVTWALATSSGHVQAATRARVGVWIAVASAALAGGGLAWVNFLLGVGAGL